MFLFVFVCLQHAPFAPARALLVEHGLEHLEILVHDAIGTLQTIQTKDLVPVSSVTHTSNNSTDSDSSDANTNTNMNMNTNTTRTLTAEDFQTV